MTGWRRVERLMLDAARQVLAERGLSPGDLAMDRPSCEALGILAAHERLLIEIQRSRVERALDYYTAMLECFDTLCDVERHPDYFITANLEADLRRGARARRAHGDVIGRRRTARVMAKGGAQTKQIAAHLGVDRRTVQRYLK